MCQTTVSFIYVHPALLSNISMSETEKISFEKFITFRGEWATHTRPGVPSHISECSYEGKVYLDDFSTDSDFKALATTIY